MLMKAEADAQVPVGAGGIPALELSFVAEISVYVGAPVTVGETGAGLRRVVPILGGAVAGPRLGGRILPGGADFQILRPGGVMELEAKYVIEASGGPPIYVVNRGLRHGPAEAVEKLMRGEPVDPTLIYFRTAPVFETAAPEYTWMTRSLFVCTGMRLPDQVRLRLYEIT
ncbi:MAG: DUF3237 domain-containing protein [Beijerinckiaceae bacterium]